jgi:hypothetical protein
MGSLVLKDFLKRIEEFDPYLVAYVPEGAEPTANSLVTVVDFLGPQTPKPVGTRYLLEVHNIKDVLDTWSKWRGGRAPTDDERVEAVLCYSKYDSYIPVR